MTGLQIHYNISYGMKMFSIPAAGCCDTLALSETNNTRIRTSVTNLKNYEVSINSQCQSHFINEE